jgi:hypothetical protein
LAQLLQWSCRRGVVACAGRAKLIDLLFETNQDSECLFVPSSGTVLRSDGDHRPEESKPIRVGLR